MVICFKHSYLHVLLHCTYTLFIYYTNNKLQLEYILYVTKNNEEEEEE